jgi:hypothetical protein
MPIRVPENKNARHKAGRFILWRPQGDVAAGFPASRDTCASMHIVTD